MMLILFNINGICVCLYQLEELLSKYKFILVGLQEIKVQDSEFLEQVICDLGYYFYYYGQKGYYGVVLLIRELLEDVQYGFFFDGEDVQCCMIIGWLCDVYGQLLMVLNGYFFQGENWEYLVKFFVKEKFYQDLQYYLENYYDVGEKLVIMGDFNIFFIDCDIGIGEVNCKCWLCEGKISFLFEEWEWWQCLIDWGLEDIFCCQYLDIDDVFFWFDYCFRGFEWDLCCGLCIDIVLVIKLLVVYLSDCGVDYEMCVMECFLDYCLVWSWFDNLFL